MKKRVGIFMQLFRNEESMHEAIKSVLGQTYKNFKFYIMVSEETHAIVTQYANIDSRIEVLIGKPGDSSYTYDKYIARDQNEYFTVIDADDWYTKDYLEELINFAELNGTDITACGNYFINNADQVVGKRVQEEMIWDSVYTGQVIHLVYAFFRTIWGKLIRSEIIYQYDQDSLPKSIQYGGYGGDTIFMFHLLPLTKKVGIVNKLLYVYRISSGENDSRSIKPGRLDSDTFVLNFVREKLQMFGGLQEKQVQFLYLIYANAVVDTLQLLSKAYVIDERIGKVRYIFENEYFSELLIRERTDALFINGEQRKNYRNEFYSIVFKDIIGKELKEELVSECRKIYELLYAEYKGVFSVEEFMVLIKIEGCLDVFCEKDYEKTFNKIIEWIENGTDKEKEVILGLLRRLTTCENLKNYLRNSHFTFQNKSIIIACNQKNIGRVFEEIHGSLVECESLNNEETLVNMWIEMAAYFQCIEEFILSSEYRIDLLIRMNKIDDAKEQLIELIQMGVKDDNINLLKEYLFGGERNE